jgi:hypothetical protein
MLPVPMVVEMIAPPAGKPSKEGGEFGVPMASGASEPPSTSVFLCWRWLPRRLERLSDGMSSDPRGHVATVPHARGPSNGPGATFSDSVAAGRIRPRVSRQRRRDASSDAVAQWRQAGCAGGRVKKVEEVPKTRARMEGRRTASPMFVEFFAMAASVL